MAKTLEIEVIAYILGSMDHCSHCQVFIDGVGMGKTIHQADMDSYPPEWMGEWQKLSDLIFNITEKFAGKLPIKITDAQSPQAMWKALRHGVRKYPSFIINGEKYHGVDEESLTQIIQSQLLLN